jgi:hypothetical protein
MDPDPDPGGPKTYGSGFGSKPLTNMDPDPGGLKTPDPQHCLFVAVDVAAQAALGSNLLEEAEVGEAVGRETAVEEGHGPGEAVAEGAQLTLLLLVSGAEAGPPLLPHPEKVQIDLCKKK